LRWLAFASILPILFPLALYYLILQFVPGRFEIDRIVHIQTLLLGSAIIAGNVISDFGEIADRNTQYYLKKRGSRRLTATLSIVAIIIYVIITTRLQFVHHSIATGGAGAYERLSWFIYIAITLGALDIKVFIVRESA
jgi:uncharacterized membrane protein